MKSFIIYYEDSMGNKKSTTERATCPDVAELQFSNKHPHWKVIEVE